MKPNIALGDEQRQGVVEILSRLLADEYLLYTKTRNYHWNVVGLQFHDLHKLFEAQYEELDDDVDDVAERIRAVGAPSPGTLAEFVKQAHLTEQPGQVPAAKDMIAALLADHEALTRTLRSDVETTASKLGDAGTSDFLTGLMEKHEKTAWMLRAMLE